MGKTQTSLQNKKWKDDLFLFVINNKAFLILIVIMIVSTLLSGGKFLRPSNMSSVIRQIAVYCILGLGFSVVLSSGGVDLSIGNMLGLSGVLYALSSKALPFPLAIGIALLTGIICGAINGVIIVKLKLPPFIVTLATSQIYYGFAYIFCGGRVISDLSKAVSFIGQGTIFGAIPFAIVIPAILTVVIAVLVYRTKFGRFAIAIGGNDNAARVSGIPVDKIRIYIYMIMGVCSAFAGIVLTGRTSLANAAAGDGMEMDAIAAVVIGGTPMSGGKIKVGGTIFGCLIMGVMNNLLNLMGISSFWQNVAKGIIIILAILLDAQTDAFFNSRRKRISID